MQIDSTHTPDYSDLDKVLVYCGHAQAKLEKALAAEVVPVRTEKSKVRLPALELPSFSGEFSEFNVFYESFKSLIHDNKELDNTQKVQYLVSKLSGKALTVCAGVPATADNYSIIFNNLVEKYQCKRSQAKAYLSNILNFKQIKGESPDQLNSLIDELCASVLALKKVDLDSLSDFMLAHITLSKIDSETGRLFEMSLKSGEIPTFSKVHNFLKDQVKILTRLEVPTSGPSKVVASTSQKTSPPNKESLHHLRHLPWADPEFHTPASVDAIVGAQLFSELFQVTRVLHPGGPVAMETRLGYVMMGSVSSASNSNQLDNHSFHLVEKPLELLVQKFWEIEDVCTPKVLNQEETDCEEIFQSTVSRDVSGRYSIAMPFQHDPSNLGNSYFGAERRFYSLERKLHANPSLLLDYSSIIQSYLDKGFVSLVDNDNHATGYYVPHHVVVKQESLSTKNRIVFDYSFKSDSGKSLNDLLYTGAKLYSDLFVILLNFRLYQIAMTADIAKMYLQINMVPDHHQYQKLLWRFRTDEPLRTYWLTTLNFGLNSAPFLALRTVKQLIEDERCNFPLACEVAGRDMYMDDFACSISDVDEARTLQNQLVGLFRAGGFNLTKWSSNSQQVLENIPASDQVSNLVEWDSDSADSSEQAYGGVVYCRTTLSSGQVFVHLVCSKSRVAPLRSTSLPRLELCGALLLSQLMVRVFDAYKVRQKIDKIYCFSDSMVALHWIHSSPHRWQTFVANRVAKIQELISQDVWFHVAGHSNPADCLTRPIMPQEFSDHPLWFTGPDWLKSDIADWPLNSFEGGAFFGALFGGLAMKFGRRTVLLASAPPLSLSWMCTVFATDTSTMYVTSFVGGFCCAIILTVAQVCPPPHSP
ncbi:hypothetical protein M8J77_014484 [Diaphorina citri]|nr:hypothetical protein M8J77_014484 [Diaphorina citri]